MKEYIANVKGYLSCKIDIINDILSNYLGLNYSKNNFENLYNDIDNANCLSLLKVDDEPNSKDYYKLIEMLEHQKETLQLMLNAIEGNTN